MAKAVGIDLGTTNSVVAVMEAGEPKVIANAEGGRTTPSVVAYTKDGDRLVGAVARRQAVMNPTGTVFSAKRFIGHKINEVSEETKRVPYKVQPGPNDAVRFEIHNKQVAPEEIGAQVLRKLVDDASAYLGEKVTDAVVTVPAYFNDAQRQATKDAGKIAGLNVLRVINEPTAAALAYGMTKKKNETVMVFDLGGGTFDVSVMEVGEGVCEVKSTAGDTHLGGDDFDQALVDHIASEFKREQGIDLRNDRQALQRLYEAAERAKCELSSSMTTQISLPFITADANGPKHLNMELTRAKFEQLTSHLVERCRGPVKQALEDAKLKETDIQEVILVGGSTRIPAVQDLVRKMTAGKQPNMSVNPDEVVAVGAAVQAGILQGEVNEVLLLDVIPLSLGLETMGGVMTKIVSRNTTIPCSKSETFSTAADSQPAVDIVVLQGEREMARDNRILGQFKLEGIRPAPRGVPQIEVKFDVDANGILNVSARDRDTGKEQKIAISGSTNLDKHEVERMVKEAEGHAAEDKKKREEIESLNNLDSAAYQLERALNDLGDKAPAHERARAEDLIKQAREIVANKGPAEKARPLMSDIQQAASGLSAHANAGPDYAHTGAGPQGAAGAGGPGPKPGDDVIDAEFEKK